VHNLLHELACPGLLLISRKRLQLLPSCSGGWCCGRGWCWCWWSCCCDGGLLLLFGGRRRQQWALRCLLRLRCSTLPANRAALVF
jgi:hypothetical protein